MNLVNRWSRRGFVRAAGAAAAVAATSSILGSRAVAAVALGGKIPLGMDNFAVRAMKWKAEQLIDYAAELKLDSLFITDLDSFASLEPEALQRLRAKAEGQGLKIQLGSWSICPTSKSFRNNRGTAAEHLALGLRCAKDLGSPVFRVVLGSADDRKTPGGIKARIADTVQVCKALEAESKKHRVKIAVENHAGDMMSHELVELVEAAGRDFVGVNIDPGNAAWTLEDPVRNLETLAPYVLTSSMRDSMIWESDHGAKVQWTAMGEGCVDLKRYFQIFAERCPGVPVHIETISGFAREFPYLKQEFWAPYASVRGADFAAFLALAKKGKAIEPHRSANEQEEQKYQKGELERSIQYCRGTLGLGVRS